MCTILLMELKTPAEVTTFVEDNLRSSALDMKAFTSQFLARRFGKASATAMGPNSSSLGGQLDEEAEFVTVHRKPSRKPSAK